MPIVNRLLGPPGNRKLAKMTFFFAQRQNKGLGLSAEDADKVAKGLSLFTGADVGELAAYLKMNKADPNGDITGGPVPFPVMYNPDSLKMSHGAAFSELTKPGDGNPFAQFAYSKPKSLIVDLLFDATGASVSNGIWGTNFQALLNKGFEGIDIIVHTFLRLALNINKDAHETNYVTVIWGAILFKGVVTSAEVTYTMFDRIGRPLRGTVKVTMSSTADEQKASTPTSAGGATSDTTKKSPDLTKTKVVKAGDTLHLLAKREYGDESYYLQLAEANNLKNYRKLTPGQRLIFPPIKKVE